MFEFGESSTSEQSMSTPFGESSAPGFSASSSPALGASSSSSFRGSSLSGETPAFRGFEPSPAQSSSLFGSAFQQIQSTFGSPVFGSTTRFGGTSTPAFGATSSPAFGATSCPAFGATSTPALDASSSSSFRGSSLSGETPAFRGFGSSPAQSSSLLGSAFGALSTPSFSFGSTPTFGQTQSTFGSTPFGATPSALGVGRLESISAMPVYMDKSHEELRWEDYQRGDKGGPNQNQNPMGSTSAFGMTSQTQVNQFGAMRAFGETFSNPFSAPNALNPWGSNTPNWSTSTGFGSTPSHVGSPSSTSFGTSTPLGSTTLTTTPSVFGTAPSTGSAFGSTVMPSLFGASNMPAFRSTQNTASAFGSTNLSPFRSTFDSATQSSVLFQTSTPAFESRPSSFGQMQAANTGFGQQSRSAFGQQNGSAFGQPSEHAFGQHSGSAFRHESGQESQNTALAFGSTNLSPFDSTTQSPGMFQSSTPAFGSSHSSFGQPPAGNTGFGQQSRSALGHQNGYVFGQPSGPAFGQRHNGFAIRQDGESAFRQESGLATQNTASAFRSTNLSPFESTFGSATQSSGLFQLSTPAFGSSPSPFGQPPYGNTGFGEQSRSVFGQREPAFGQESGPAFGQHNESAFTLESEHATFGRATQSPGLFQPSTLVFGSSPSSFGQSSAGNTGFGQHSGAVFGQQSGHAFGQPYEPAFGQHDGSSFRHESGNATQNTASAFGSTSLSPFGSTFGSTTQSSGLFQPSTPPFGSCPSPFGQPPGCNTGFGQQSWSTFGQQSGPALGQSSRSTLRQESEPAFGQKSGSSLGKKSKHVLGQKSGPTFGQQNGVVFRQQNGHAFGQSSGYASVQKSESAFGQSSGSVSGQKSGSAFGHQCGSVFDGRLFNTHQPVTGFGESLFSNSTLSTKFQPAQPTSTSSGFSFGNFGETQSAASSGGFGSAFNTSSSDQMPNNNQQNVVIEQPTILTNPFGTLPSTPTISTSHVGSTPFIQYGISSMHVPDKALVTTRTSMSVPRHLSQRRIQLPLKRYNSTVYTPKDEDKLPPPPKAGASFIPRENPRSLIICPIEEWPQVQIPDPEINNVSRNGPGTKNQNNGGLFDGPYAPFTYESSDDSDDSDDGNDYHDEEISPQKKPRNSTVKPPPTKQEPPKMPKLTHIDYYTIPQIPELAMKARLEPGSLTRVKDFTIGREGYGSIKFYGETDLTGLDLDSVIRFGNREVVVYEDEAAKPPVGKGLNKPAEVTLRNIKWVNKKNGKQYLHKEKVEKHTWILKRKCEEQGAEFISYDAMKGEWKFKVQNF